MASGKIIETDDGLAECEEFLQDIGADETGDAGNCPYPGVGHKFVSKSRIRCGDHELSVEGYPPGRLHGRDAREHVYQITRAASHGSQRRDEASSIPRPRRRGQAVSCCHVASYAGAKKCSLSLRQFLSRVCPSLW